MEKTVTLRFYDVSRTSADKPALIDVLDLISAKPLAERGAQIGEEEILVRLEDYERDDNHASGQLVRGQSGNRPGRMMPDGTNALPFDEPLGHSIAFRYSINDGLFAVQFDNRVLSPSKIMTYFYAHDPRAEYHLEPRMREDAWDRFDELPLRKLEIAVAGRPNILDGEDEGDSVWANISRLKESYHADTVRIQLSMGHRAGALGAETKTIAREAIQRFRNQQDDIRALRGVLETGEGIPNDEVDLMGELFDVKESLEFQENNFAMFYQLRKNLLADRIRLLD